MELCSFLFFSQTRNINLKKRGEIMTIFYVEKSDLESGLPPKLFSEEEVRERLENLRKTGNLKDDFVFEDQFVPRELTPPVEKKSFSISIAVFGKKKIGGSSNFYFATAEEATLNRGNIDPFWFKVLEAIKDIKFTRLISVTLNSDGCYHAIGVNQIGENIFSHFYGSDNFAFCTKQEFSQIFETSTESEIRDRFVSGLKRFLEKISEKKDVVGYVHSETGQRIYATLFCPKPSDIQVVSEEERQ